MSGVLVSAKKRRHPQGKSLSEALREGKDYRKAQKGLVNKKATLLKTEGDGELEVGATMRPNDEQLDRINKYTRKTVTADEVVAFTTLSCNDLVDRDDDKFTTQCIKDFVELKEPYSFTGKSFMLDHVYKVDNAVGRIFGTGTKNISGVNFVTNEVYVPNTPKNKSFIEDIDFGINWAVSVGVVLGKTECSLEWCKSPMHSFWGFSFCENGHDKSAYYTEDAEEDAWGYPIPCDPSEKGAQKCIQHFMDPKDAYELSQVWLGAQYFAELEKDPEFKSLMKSVTKEVPIVGLSKEEAKKLPIKHEPDKVSEARVQFGLKVKEDGTVTWKDDRNLIWTFDPSNPEDGVMSLGRSAETNEEETEENNGEGNPTGLDEHDEGDASGGEGLQGESDPDTGSVGGSGNEGDHPAEGSEQPLGGESSEVTEDSENDEEKGVSKKDVLSAARKLNLPSSWIAAADKAEGNGLDALLLAAGTEVQNLKSESENLSVKAELGAQYVESLKTEAIEWYVKARQTSQSQKVSVTAFERILERCGDDVEAIKGLISDNKDLARERFPKSVRRSSFPTDPNATKDVPEFNDSDSEAAVRRLHS